MAQSKSSTIVSTEVTPELLRTKTNREIPDGEALYSYFILNYGMESWSPQEGFLVNPM